MKNNNTYGLTKRECEVLKLLTLGLTNTQISKRLLITIHTTKAHVASILRKLNVHKRVLAAAFAFRENVI